MYHQTADTEEDREEEGSHALCIHVTGILSSVHTINFIVDGFLDAAMHHQTAGTEEDREEEGIVYWYDT